MFSSGGTSIVFLYSPEPSKSPTWQHMSSIWKHLILSRESCCLWQMMTIRPGPAIRHGSARSCLIVPVELNIVTSGCKHYILLTEMPSLHYCWFYFGISNPSTVLVSANMTIIHSSKRFYSTQ
jgi:hypothetical protein